MQFNDSSSPAAVVSVMIVEDHTAIRELLAHYLSACPGFTVVAEASTADEALRLAAVHRPQVVVLDWMLENGTGLNFLREGMLRTPPPRVLVFSANTSDRAVREALSNGAKGYLEKSAKFTEFTEALSAVAEGHVYLSPEIARAVHRMACHPESSELKTALTERELTVLRCLAEGMTSKMIAKKLSISVRTVGNHRLRIAQKTGLGSIAQMTLHAARLGLLSELQVG